MVGESIRLGAGDQGGLTTAQEHYRRRNHPQRRRADARSRLSEIGKPRIAHALADAGVQRIKGGMAAVSPEDANALRQMGEEIRGAESCSFFRTRTDDVDLIAKCKIHRAV